MSVGPAQPVGRPGRALGVLGMMDGRSLSFRPPELALFNAVGERLGIAVERARLFAQPSMPGISMSRTTTSGRLGEQDL